MPSKSSNRLRYVAALLPLLVLAALAARPAAPGTRAGPGPRPPVDKQILYGRFLVLSHGCYGCHGGVDPNDTTWLSGSRGPAMDFKIGPCELDPAAKPCFTTRPRNLTPDNATGLGRFTERQIFNALRYGLRPEDTPDVEITSTIPGQGNFPEHPHYLAPPMPWPAWRYMTDADLRAIIAYLKRGIRPVVNKVPESEGPPDFWASQYTPAKIGAYPAPPFPGASEIGGQDLAAPPRK